MHKVETPEEKRIRKRDELIVRANSKYGMGTKKEIAVIFGFYESECESFYKWLRQPGFPPPVVQNGHRPKWFFSEIRDYLASKRAEQNAWS